MNPPEQASKTHRLMPLALALLVVLLGFGAWFVQDRLASAAAAAQSTETSMAEMAKLREGRAAKPQSPARSPWKGYTYALLAGPYTEQAAAEAALAKLKAAHPKANVIAGPSQDRPDALDFAILVTVLRDEAAANALKAQLEQQGYKVNINKQRELRDDITREELQALDDQLAAEHEHAHAADTGA